MGWTPAQRPPDEKERLQLLKDLEVSSYMVRILQKLRRAAARYARRTSVWRYYKHG